MRKHHHVGSATIFPAESGSGVAIQYLVSGLLVGLPTLTAADARKFAAALIESAEYIEQRESAGTTERAA